MLGNFVPVFPRDKYIPCHRIVTIVIRFGRAIQNGRNNTQGSFMELICTLIIIVFVGFLLSLETRWYSFDLLLPSFMSRTACLRRQAMVSSTYSKARVSWRGLHHLKWLGLTTSLSSSLIVSWLFRIGKDPPPLSFLLVLSCVYRISQGRKTAYSSNSQRSGT